MTTPIPASPRRRRPIVLAGRGILFLAAFGGWSALVFGTNELPEFDEHLMRAFTAHAAENPTLRGLMVVATMCGGIRATMFLAGCGALWMWIAKRRAFAVAWLAIALVGGLLVLVSKTGFNRDRPPEEMRDAEILQKNESYPSGHSTGSAIGYGLIAFVLCRRFPDRRRFVIVVALMGWVALIGLSRMYLRAHWFSDVIGGFLLGLGYLHLCFAGIATWRGTLDRQDYPG